MERGERSLMASWSHLAQFPVQNMLGPHPLPLLFVLSARNRAKLDEGRKSQLSNAQGKGSIP